MQKCANVCQLEGEKFWLHLWFPEIMYSDSFIVYLIIYFDAFPAFLQPTKAMSKYLHKKF